MKEAVLEKLKKNYEELKRYTIMDENKLIERATDGVEDETVHDSNEIMIYMGTYYHAYESDAFTSGLEILVQDDGEYPRVFKKFLDLENGFTYHVRMKDCKRFESEHIVVYIPNARNYESKYTFQEDYNKLRRIFFKEAIENGQESAIRLVASQNKIKELFSVRNFLLENGINLLVLDEFEKEALCNKRELPNTTDPEIIEDTVKRLRFKKWVLLWPNIGHFFVNLFYIITNNNLRRDFLWAKKNYFILMTY